LDEFNRINVEVLSVVAQQMNQISQAKKSRKDVFEFDAGAATGPSKIPLCQTANVIITMNPGYAGRTELPDNLKIFFRPVCMMIPNYALIAEIMLFAEGFGTAKPLSVKMAKMYKLASEQLSQQDHYDFGMRAVKSVLVMAGVLKRANPDLAEDATLIRALRDSNVPKFLAEDLPLFFAILVDLFPGVHVPLVDYGSLKSCIETSALELHLQVVPDHVFKTIQLWETFIVRFGVMLVGPTGGGKSQVAACLRTALSKLYEAPVEEGEEKDEAYQPVISFVFNPKSISMGEMYGEFNDLTQEWTDGLASRIMRSVVEQDYDALDEILPKRIPDRKVATTCWKWVIFDGPVDAVKPDSDRPDAGFVSKSFAYTEQVAAFRILRRAAEADSL
jgi:dynein heavy chain